MSYKHTPLVGQEDPESSAQEVASDSYVQQLPRVSWRNARGALGILAAACALVLIRDHLADSGTRGGSEVRYVNDTIGLAASSPKPKLPCHCEADAQSWKKKQRPQGSKPKCVYFALGANDGDMYRSFLTSSAPGTAEDLGSFARVKEVNQLQSWKRHNIFQRFKDWSWRSMSSLLGWKEVIFHLGPDHHDGGECEAYLIEMNDAWSDELGELVEETTKQRPGTQVTALVPKAVFMCEGTASFEIDVETTESIATSMGNALGKKKVSVPTLNLLRLLYENTTPEDFVILDMDIEGAEFDILPCLAKSPGAGLIDEIDMELHYSS